ncbi:MAG: hypothetical protein DMF96_00810 [Acidobacteria bacterium]|nr:MAG: hypothetical protein DMF96_00810 [Acidobacteriota bacterium]
MVASITIGIVSAARAGQLGKLLSPGPLARAHGALEGGANCQRCHEAGRRVAAARCLTCHKPIADRIARRTGVHRTAKECVSCHVEHAGVDAELRHMDTRTFDHAGETGFALDGQHAKPAANCAACHKTRSFVEARPVCSSCHTDVHKGALGTDCTRCHSTKIPFKESRSQFDHTGARFQLTGAHREVKCEKCHKTSAFRGMEFGTCSACHESPHGRKFPATCTSCHTTEKWGTRSVDHSKTNFPLVGAHAEVTCAKCHQSAAMTKPVRFNQCSACHVNVHRDSLKEDCRVCHTETGFQGAAFDHASRTAFALDGKHEGVACRKCHTGISAPEVPLGRKVVDYGGARRECVACHGDKDPHKGEFGRVCESCHKTTTFGAKDFKHPRAPDFFGGQHEHVACEKCHVPGKMPQPFRTGASVAVIAAIASPSTAPGAAVPAKAPLMECASCHADVHLGQVGLACERCHAIDGVKFAAGRFSHERSQFPLTGKHQSTECAKCHLTETRAFPSGTGTAMRLHPVDNRCQACHKDPHLGQVDAECQTCHDTATFAMSTYTHRGMEDFFGGFHGRYACKECHKSETGQFPAGRGTAVRLMVGRACSACHRQ